MFPHRFNTPSREELETSVVQQLEHNAERGVIVQFYAPGQYPAAVLQAVDALCARYAERVEVRFYGHYLGDVFDGKTLRALPNVRTLNLDCLETAAGLDTLRELEHLSHLELGIEHIDLNPLLAFANLQALTGLRLSQSSGPKVDLSPVARMSGLQQLALGVRNQGLEALRGHPAITQLNLHRQPATSTFEVVATLPRLQRLSVAFGSRETMPELHSSSVTHVELIRVRGLNRFDLELFPALEVLEVEDQPHLAALNLLATPKLRALRLSNLKSLARLDGLGDSTLQQLFIYKTPELDLPALFDTLPATLQSLKLATGKRKVDELLAARQQARGIAEYMGPIS